MCVISAVVNISKPVWHKYGTQGNEWKKGMYYMDPSNSIAGYVVFEATHGNGVFGDIALDDISITDGLCPTTYGNEAADMKILRLPCANFIFI